MCGVGGGDWLQTLTLARVVPNSGIVDIVMLWIRTAGQIIGLCRVDIIAVEIDDGVDERGCEWERSDN